MVEKFKPITFLKVIFLENVQKEEKLLENTTIIIVGDHGKRSYTQSKKEEGYNIPLVIYSKKINHSQ